MSEKVIIISGGSRGLGAELVRACLQRGWSVATFSRTKTSIVESFLADPAFSGRLFWQSIDGSDTALLKKFPMQVYRQFGQINGLVNNMGIGVDGLFALMREDEVDRCIDINLKAAIHLTQGCSRLMLRQSSGSIVNISSVNAIRGHAGVSVYSACKAGLEGLTRSLAREMGEKSIRINTVAPGYFQSELVADLSDAQIARIERRTPLGRLASVGDIAEAVLFLLSDKSSFITGQQLAVDGGITC